MAGQRSMTDVELRAYEKQRREARRALFALVVLVGGLSGMAIFLAASSRAEREQMASLSPDLKDNRAASPAVALSEPVAAKPVPLPPAVAPEKRPATAEEISRSVREQGHNSVLACIERNTRRSSKRSPKVTVKLDVKPPDRVARVDVVASPKSPALVKCVKQKLRGLSIPKVASNLSVSVPFKLDSAKGRRPAR